MNSGASATNEGAANSRFSRTGRTCENDFTRKLTWSIVKRGCRELPIIFYCTHDPGVLEERQRRLRNPVLARPSMAMAGMLRSEARSHGVSIYTDIKNDLPMSVADRVQLQQV